MYSNFDNSLNIPDGVNLTTELKSNSLNVMVVGLGGLGVVSLAQKLRNLIAQRYPHVHTIEQRGIAQRRSSTSAVVSAANFFVSPSLSETKVNLLIALEPLEALRFSHLLKPNGMCFISDSRIETICGSHPKYAYPDTEEIIKSIERCGAYCLTLPTAEWLKTEELLPFHVSSAMLGMFCAAFNFDYPKYKKTICDQKNLAACQWGFKQFNNLYKPHEYSNPVMRQFRPVSYFSQPELKVEYAV